GDPPAQADEEEAPVVEELRRLALEGMADELEDPAYQKQREGEGPDPADEQRDHRQRQRQHDQRNAERVAEPVDRVLMALRVLRDPLVPRASTEHAHLPPSAGGRTRADSIAAASRGASSAAPGPCGWRAASPPPCTAPPSGKTRPERPDCA